MIRTDQPELRASEPAVKRQRTAAAVDMSVIAALYLILLKKLQNLISAIILEDRRIVEKHDLFPIPARLE